MSYLKCWFGNSTGIKNELTTYLGRLYTKEFFYLFTEGKYSPNTSQFILLHYFDNVIWQVEQLQKNGFFVLGIEYKKKRMMKNPYMIVMMMAFL